MKSTADDPSLAAFQANFCAPHEVVPPQASGSGIFRNTMTLPGVYWLIDAPFARVIGLYSNRLENPGYLEGRTAKGKDDLSQLAWLETTLKAIAKMKEKKALIVAAHHPPYSQAGHAGSTDMSKSIDDICEKTGVFPVPSREWLELKLA